MRSEAVRKTFGDVAVSVGEDLVATVEIRRPPDNFLDATLVSSLADSYAWLDREAGARAIVLCSEGKHFCAGADLTGQSEHASQVGAPAAAQEIYDHALRLFEARLPVVAAVQGTAIGGGLGLACTADFRVAGPWARFAANFARIGLHHGFGLSVTLPAIVGQQVAMRMLYAGQRIDGAEAARIGLADVLADESEVRSAAIGLATEVALSAPLAVRSMRQTMRYGLTDRLRAAIDHELAEQDRLWRSADFAEGVRATAERRTPRFYGR